MGVLGVKGRFVGCREAKPNRTGTTPVLALRLSGLEWRNSLRSLTPYDFHRPGWRVWP